jgi:hypothetical protein
MSAYVDRTFWAHDVRFQENPCPFQPLSFHAEVSHLEHNTRLQSLVERVETKRLFIVPGNT